MKRAGVILLGDSISLGYRDYVRYNTCDVFNVIYPREQGKFASDIYRMLYEWHFGIKDSDNIRFVYWNAGLWDLVRIFGEDAQTSIDEYKKYLVRTAKRIRYLYPRAKICFALTTAVNEKGYPPNFKRFNSDIVEYNRAAQMSLKDHVDMFDDLYELTKPLSEDCYVDATHFTNKTNRFLASHIEMLLKEELNEEIEKYNEAKDEYRKITNEVLEGIKNEVEKKEVVCWGMGDTFEGYYKILKNFFVIKNVVDADKSLWGATIHKVKCISPSEINASSIVVVTVDNPYSRDEIKEWCMHYGIACFFYDSILNVMWPRFEEEWLAENKEGFIDADPCVKSRMIKYIGLHLVENNCNFDCEYCYLSVNPQRRFVNHNRCNPHNPLFVRKCFSKKQLGGACLIGVTGTGETMLADGINDICVELLKEGHYLHIVTNGTVLSKIRDLIERAGKYSQHIIFKLSFHYKELKERNLLSRFVETVNIIDNSQASYTIELLPYDGIINMIPEIKEFSLKNFGAFPQLTIGRDEKRNTRLLSDMSFEQYASIWDEFDSNMFKFRKELYMTKGVNCYAGPLGFFVDLFSGNVKHCVYNEVVGNIYLDKFEDIDLTRVGNSCPLPYCFNCHVYAALGVLPMKGVPTYGEIRDREKSDGTHWIKEDMLDFLKTKLYENA